MPNTTNDSMSSVVITGRRMQVSERDMSGRPFLRIAHLDLCALGQKQAAIDDDSLAAVQAVRHNDFAVLRAADDNRLHMRCAVDNRENVIAALANLNGLARRDDRVRLVTKRHLKIA